LLGKITEWGVTIPNTEDSFANLKAVARKCHTALGIVELDIKANAVPTFRVGEIEYEYVVTLDKIKARKTINSQRFVSKCIVQTEQTRSSLHLPYDYAVFRMKCGHHGFCRDGECGIDKNQT
jgi:hypothetical protein